MNAPTAAAGATGCAVMLMALGLTMRNAQLVPIDRLAGILYAHGIAAARIFTASGRAPALVAIFVAAFAIAALHRWPLWVPSFVAISQLLTQGLAELLKQRFARMRPEHWIGVHERGNSYPSGHATTAAVTYGGWALVVANSNALPHTARAALVGILLVWALGVAWSRIALGAHYLTDVIGGLLLGCAWNGAALALLLALHR